MKSRVRDLVEQGDREFSRRAPVLPLWQTMAEMFCPIRAEFTTKRSLGEEYASHLMTGRPILAHRDLSNCLSAMLRPRGQAWFHPRTDNEPINNDAGARQFLDGIGDVMRRIMYAQHSGFVRATKQCDQDFAAFGQGVISVDRDPDVTGFLYRNWHLRDVAWCENDRMVIDVVHHNWNYAARSLVKRFPGKVSSKINDLLDKEPYREIKCRRVVLPADEYDLAENKPRNRERFPFVSIMVDTENDTILEEVPARRLPYVIPRWLTLPGSPIAHSLATVVALPDARLLQQINLTLLEAGQKAVDPPMKAVAEVIGGGVNMFSGGITWVDAEYDERSGAALEPLFDTSRLNLAWGDKREEKIETLIQEAFYLNVINLPEAQKGDKMTAYETSERVKEYIRRALPLFEPIEVEYNGALCEITFEMAMDANAFGSFEDMPPLLRGRDIQWQFESPLQGANERIKAEQFRGSCQMLAMAAEIDPTTRHDFDTSAAFRDALLSTARADWIVPAEQAAAARQQEAQQQQAMQAAQALATGADVAGRVGEAARGLGEGGQALQQSGMA